jgi:hypothetical protein
MMTTIDENEISWKNIKFLRADIKSNVLGSIDGYMGTLQCESISTGFTRSLYFIKIVEGQYEAVEQLPTLPIAENETVDIVNSTIEQMFLEYKLSLLNK